MVPKLFSSLLSSLLLLLAYSSFSWFLSHQALGPVAWAVAIAFTLAQALLLTIQADRSQLALNGWLQSDLGYFSLVIIGAIFIAFAFVWARIFGYVLVVFAAEILVRLDLQLMGFNRAQSLVILMLVSFGGLSVGWVASQYIQP